MDVTQRLIAKVVVTAAVTRVFSGSIEDGGSHQLECWTWTVEEGWAQHGSAHFWQEDLGHWIYHEVLTSVVRDACASYHIYTLYDL